MSETRGRKETGGGTSGRFPHGHRLRQARKDAGLSVEHVAIAMQKTSFTIQGYELGRIEPPLHILSAMALMMNTTVGALIGERPPTMAEAIPAPAEATARRVIRLLGEGQQ